MIKLRSIIGFMNRPPGGNGWGGGTKGVSNYSEHYPTKEMWVASIATKQKFSQILFASRCLFESIQLIVDKLT